jgi:hypothetical protein
MKMIKHKIPMNRQERRILIFTLVKLRFNRLSAADKATLARHVTGKMTNNANFPNPTPSLSDLADAAKALDDTQAVLDGSKQKTLARNTAETKLDKMMRQLQSYVSMIAAGDRQIILSSGMDVRSPRTVKQKPEAVTGITLKLGQFPGSIDIKWQGQGRGCLYKVFASTNPQDEASWKFMDSTSKQRITIEGLEGGLVYYFRIVCLNTAGKGPHSEVYSMKAY